MPEKLRQGGWEWVEWIMFDQYSHHGLQNQFIPMIFGRRCLGLSNYVGIDAREMITEDSDQPLNMAMYTVFLQEYQSFEQSMVESFSPDILPANRQHKIVLDFVQHLP